MKGGFSFEKFGKRVHMLEEKHQQIKFNPLFVLIETIQTSSGQIGTRLTTCWYSCDRCLLVQLAN